jgi:hypothetical protein
LDTPSVREPDVTLTPNPLRQCKNLCILRQFLAELTAGFPTLEEAKHIVKLYVGITDYDWFNSLVEAD